MDSMAKVLQYGQSIWLDYIRRGLITSGFLNKLVDDGLRGLTSNPTIFQKAIADSSDYDEAISNTLRSKPDSTVEDIYDSLIIEDIQMAADILRPVYDHTDGGDGFVSIETNPRLAYDTEATVEEVDRLWHLVDRPNVMVKVPATRPGIPAIETLIGKGININITLMFSLDHYEAVSQAYLRGAQHYGKPRQAASVASFFVSRVDTYVDRELDKLGTEEAMSMRGKVAIANSKVVYRRFKQVFPEDGFDRKVPGDIPRQRVLWGSTSTKNPEYSDLLYVESLIGPNTVNTMPPETLEAFRDHGNVLPTLEEGMGEADALLDRVRGVGINLDGITEQLQIDGVKAFADSYDQTLEAIDSKKGELAARLS
jgi:transaldolase